MAQNLPFTHHPLLGHPEKKNTHWRPLEYCAPGPARGSCSIHIRRAAGILRKRSCITELGYLQGWRYSRIRSCATCHNFALQRKIKNCYTKAKNQNNRFGKGTFSIKENNRKWPKIYRSYTTPYCAVWRRIISIANPLRIMQPSYC